MITCGDGMRRIALAGLCLVPALLLAGCGSSNGSSGASTPSMAPTPTSSAPSLDASKLSSIDARLETISSDRAFSMAASALHDDSDKLRTALSSAPVYAKQLNGLRIVRPKNCTAIDSAASPAGGVLNSGTSAVTAVREDASNLQAAVTRLRSQLNSVHNDIAMLQSQAAGADSGSRQRLATYTDAEQAADVNLTGAQTSVNDATDRAARATTTFGHLRSARDKAVSGC